MNALPVIGFERAIFYRRGAPAHRVLHPCYRVTAMLQLSLNGGKIRIQGSQGLLTLKQRVDLPGHVHPHECAARHRL